MFSVIRELCKDKIEESDSWITKEYNEQLNFELHQIEGLGMENIFLFCYEIAQLINQNKGLIGPSPALSSSSLVLYLLGASMVNPMEHGLLFEHFFPIDRISTIAIGMEVDWNSLIMIRNQLEGHYYKVKNYQLKGSQSCDSLEIVIDNNTILIRESKVLTELSKREFKDFANIPLNNQRVFRELSEDAKQIASLRVVKGDFLLGFTMDQHKFLSQYAPKSIVELAQSLAYLEPWCNYDLETILKRRKGVHDLTQFQKKYFKETNGIYTFPEQVSSMLQRYMGFSKQETQSYQKAVRKKINKLYTASEELFFQVGEECNYDQFDLEELWYNMNHYNMSMTDKTRKVGEALLLYWWVYVSFY